MTAGAAGGDFTMLEHRTVGVLYFLFGVVGILGNLLTILIFLRDKPLSGTRHRLHVQLAVSNIMVVAGTPFSGSSAFAGRWLFGESGCQLYGLETYIGGMGAVTFAFLLCIQRFFCTACPDYYTSSGSSGTLSLLGWIYSIVIAAAPLMGWSSYTAESSGTACGLNWHKDDYSHRSYFMALPIITAFMIAASVLALRSAFNAQPTGKQTEEEKADWFSDNHLNWLALTNLAIVSIGFSAYGYFAIWALFNHSTKMTMLASCIPPLTAKMSTCFYPIGYIVASRKFRDAYATKFIGNEEKKTN